MLIRGEALIETITLAFTVFGQRGDWCVTVTAADGIEAKDETCEREWFPLFTEMLNTAFKNASKRRFPQLSRYAARDEAKP